MVRCNEVVPVRDCMVELWGEDPPVTAVSTVQTYLLHIRQIMRAQSAGSVRLDCGVVSRRQSYELVVDEDDLDRACFEKLFASGRRCLDTGDVRRASDLLGRALSLWRGPVLTDVPVGALLAEYAVVLEEQRMCALEMRIEADMLLGRHAALVDELIGLTERHPTHESLLEKLMIALHESGRSRAAAQVYERRRRELIGRFGVEPAPRLDQLYRSIRGEDVAAGVRPSLSLGADRRG